MRKAHIAEWLITHVSTSQRASEVVGDLLEQNPSTTQFWLTITRILAALTWRWTLGAVLAVLFSFVVLAPYSLWVVPRRELAHHYDPWIFWAMFLAAAAVCFGTTTGLVVSRYGFHDRLSWMSAAIWAVLIAASCSTWMPHAFYVTALLLTAGLTALLLSSATWRHVVCVLAPTAVYAATNAVFILLSRPTSIPHMPAGAPANVIFGIVTCLTSFVIEAIVLARIRPVLFPR